MKRKLPGVTLLGIDCVDIERLVQAAEICQKDFEFEEVKLLTSLPSDQKDIVSIDSITSIEAYSQFAIERLDEYVQTPHVLIIQYDGFILNPDAWSDEFLQYDYIGAPWLVRDMQINRFDFPKELLGQYVVGNGGFSLRSKKLLSLCASLSKENFFKRYHPEDLVISIYNREFLESKGIAFAPVPLAKRFSYEAEDEDRYSWEDQFGFHGLKWTDISKWTKEHPEHQINNTLQSPKKKHKY